MNKLKWLAIVAIIVGIPVAIWRSSNVGKIFYLIMLVGAVSLAMVKISDSGMLMFFKFKKMSIESIDRLSKLSTKINLLESDIKAKERQFNEFVENRVNERVKYITESVEHHVNVDKSALRSVYEEIGEIQKSVDVLRDEQRAALKSRIFDLREKIKVAGEKIDTVSIQKEADIILEHSNLLTAEEKDRLFKDIDILSSEVKDAQDDSFYVTTGAIFRYQ